jgi:Transglycosylase-like domain
MQGAAFSGGLGFANSAWGRLRRARVRTQRRRATREQQIIVAERIRASVGLRAWGCAKRL